MKIRTDFVSNSSSSSFILAKWNLMESLTKQDFINAISDLTGTSYEELISNGECEILDKSNENDNIKINSDFTKWLKHWYSKYLYKDETGLWFEAMYEHSEDVFPSNYTKWCRFYEALRNLYYDDLPWHWTPDVKAVEIWNENIKTYNIKAIDKHLYKIINDMYNHLGIMTHREALLSEEGKMLIRFGDNSIYNIPDMSIPSKHKSMYEENTDRDKDINEAIRTSIYETESYSPARFCEILVNWFKKRGKLSAEVVWTDFADCIIGCCMHEG